MALLSHRTRVKPKKLEVCKECYIEIQNESSKMREEYSRYKSHPSGGYITDMDVKVDGDESALFHLSTYSKGYKLVS
jgi:hypothetical protein